MIGDYAYCHDCAAKAIMKQARAEFHSTYGARPIWEELAHAALAIKQAGLNPDIVMIGQPRLVRNRISEIFNQA